MLYHKEKGIIVLCVALHKLLNYGSSSAAHSETSNVRSVIMSKGQDTKKAAKKEPAKSMKEKKAAKKAKKREKTKLKPQ